MSDSRILCPACQKRLRTLDPVAVGQRFRCPRCRHAFVVAARDIVSAAPPAPVMVSQPHTLPTAVVAAPAATPVLTDADLDEVAPRAGNKAFLIVVAVAVVFLGAGVGLAVLLSGDGSGKTGPDQAARADNKAKPDDPDESKPKPKPKPDDPPRQPDDPPRLPVSSLTAEELALVNQAIDKGVNLLRQQQPNEGTWSPGHEHAVGMAALPGLTLLECGVPPDDPAVRRAAAFVRQRGPRESHTYDIALAILFLDRLGDPKDRRLIQRFGMRLLVGQSQTGGWTYRCPVVSEKEEPDLFAALEQSRPDDPLKLFEADRGDRSMAFFTAGEPGKASPPFVVGDDPTRPVRTPSGDPLLPFDQLPPRRVKPEQLPERIRRTPSLQPTPRAADLPGGDGSDNSNTQFAVLGVWAATRHGVPTEKAMALLAKRFIKSQNKNGGWGYKYATHGNALGKPAMTCAGLLGLAVGHGMVATASGKRRPVEKDPAISRGLDELSKHIDHATQTGRGAKKPARGRTRVGGAHYYYFLWSVERVGVLFGLPKIGGKDWYAWGVEELLPAQRPDGGWGGGVGPSDTCLALLFLKRANLAQDLSNKLEFFAEDK